MTSMQVNSTLLEKRTGERERQTHRRGEREREREREREGVRVCRRDTFPKLFPVLWHEWLSPPGSFFPFPAFSSLLFSFLYSFLFLEKKKLCQIYSSPGGFAPIIARTRASPAPFMVSVSLWKSFTHTRTHEHTHARAQTVREKERASPRSEVNRVARLPNCVKSPWFGGLFLSAGSHL